MNDKIVDWQFSRGPYNGRKLPHITVNFLIEVFKKSRSYVHVAENLGLERNIYFHKIMKRVADVYSIDVSHFVFVSGKLRRLPIPFENLKKDGSRKARLIKERGRKCENCNLSSWMGKDIPIELDHIDGHPSHNDITNLRLLCPNCHAQTDTYKGKNIGHHKSTARQKKIAKYGSYR